MGTKDKVLEMLLENKNSCVSGENLAAICQVSRAAIWKAINSLRENGYNIEGSTNGGYILSEQSDVFSKEMIASSLAETFPELSSTYIECYPQIDSTNTQAKRLLSECGNLRQINGHLTEAGKKYHKSLIAAESQTAGRGRLGRTFVSPVKTGIYISMIYAPEGGITDPAKITAFSAVAVCRAIKKLYNENPKIKWINDVFLHEKKICGILTEGSTNFESGIIESAIIGIGVNITSNPQIFSEELQKIAGSITENQNINKISRAKLVAQITGEVFKILEENPEEVIKEYKELSFLIGKELQVHPIIGENKSVYTAKAIDIDQDAGLIVQLSDGSTKTLSSGEVSLHSENVTL